MLRKLLTLLLVALTFVVTSPSWSYDTEAAKTYGELFSHVKGAESGKNLHLFPAEKLVDKLKKQEPFTVLDIRTPKEMNVIGVTLPGTLSIPLNALFTPESLSLIPLDQPVYVMCQSGIRSTAAGTALRHIGYKNVFIVKGGLKAVVGYLGPTQAYSALKAPSAK